jgi:hypothetical protein
MYLLTNLARKKAITFVRKIKQKFPGKENKHFCYAIQLKISSKKTGIKSATFSPSYPVKTVSVCTEILLGLHPWSLVSNGVAPFNGVLVGTVIPIVYPGTEHVPKRFVPKNVGHWHSLTQCQPRVQC